MAYKAINPLLFLYNMVLVGMIVTNWMHLVQVSNLPPSYNHIVFCVNIEQIVPKLSISIEQASY